MSDVLDPDQICRDDACEIVGVHAKHKTLHDHHEIVVHHRPSTSKKQLWQRDDPEGLAEAVERATSLNYPKPISAIMRDVADDYGPVSERSVHRYVSRLVRAGRLVKLNLGMAFAAYIQPGSRLLRDRESLREYMLGTCDLHPTTKDAYA